MSDKTARREYLQAVAEFQRGVREFAHGMNRVLDPPSIHSEPQEHDLAEAISKALGPPRPARRAPARTRGKGGAKRVR